MKALGLGDLDKSGVSELTFKSTTCIRSLARTRKYAQGEDTHDDYWLDHRRDGTSEKIVPLVTSDTAGPLGVVHLPRLWAKLTLAATADCPKVTTNAGRASIK